MCVVEGRSDTGVGSGGTRSCFGAVTDPPLVLLPVSLPFRTCFLKEWGSGDWRSLISSSKREGGRRREGRRVGPTRVRCLVDVRNPLLGVSEDIHRCHGGQTEYPDLAPDFFPPPSGEPLLDPSSRLSSRLASTATRFHTPKPFRPPDVHPRHLVSGRGRVTLTRPPNLPWGQSLG